MPLVKVSDDLYVSTDHIAAISFYPGSDDTAYLFMAGLESFQHKIPAEVARYILRITDADESFVPSSEIAKAAAEVPLTTRIAQALRHELSEGASLEVLVSWFSFTSEAEIEDALSSLIAEHVLGVHNWRYYHSDHIPAAALNEAALAGPTASPDPSAADAAPPTDSPAEYSEHSEDLKSDG